MDLSSFGDPLTTGDLVLCVYDRTDTTARLRMNVMAPAGGTCNGSPCWAQLGPSSYSYQDPSNTPSGIDRAGLKTAGMSTKAKVTGRGPDLGVPAT